MSTPLTPLFAVGAAVGSYFALRQYTKPKPIPQIKMTKDEVLKFFMDVFKDLTKYLMNDLEKFEMPQEQKEYVQRVCVNNNF
jgi:hypothetical protein